MSKDFKIEFDPVMICGMSMLAKKLGKPIEEIAQDLLQAGCMMVIARRPSLEDMQKELNTFSARTSDSKLERVLDVADEFEVDREEYMHTLLVSTFVAVMEKEFIDEE